MILLAGIPTEAPIAMVSRALSEIGARFRVFNQREFAEHQLVFSIRDRALDGWLELGGEGIPLSSIQGVYLRLMDHANLPEVQALAPDAPDRVRCAALHDALVRWAEISPARVVNRTAAMASNNSKPYQAQLIRAHGFEVPDTLITNDPDLVRAFRASHGRIIYKSISGVRSIVQTFEDSDLARLDLIRWCPVQFQAYVEGTDVRVHVVGDRVFPTRVTSSATDYRYARDQVGEAAELKATELPPEVAARCVRLAEALGLAFAGIDLRLAPDGRFFCFEVNPCPGFSYFEANTGQPIAHAVASYLAAQP
jgi:glutathione synthase/RimK-type ligase-like ATP-grasp enzyme